MGDFGSIDWTKTRFNLDASEIPAALAPGFFRSRRAGRLMSCTGVMQCLIVHIQLEMIAILQVLVVPALAIFAREARF